LVADDERPDESQDELEVAIHDVNVTCKEKRGSMKRWIHVYKKVPTHEYCFEILRGTAGKESLSSTLCVIQK
jgi:hypothetical protein